MINIIKGTFASRINFICFIFKILHFRGKENLVTLLPLNVEGGRYKSQKNYEYDYLDANLRYGIFITTNEKTNLETIKGKMKILFG